MSFEKIIADRFVYLPYKLPNEEEVQYIDFQPGVVRKVRSDILAAIGARKNSPVEGYFQSGILRIVKRESADVIEPFKAPAQKLAEKLANGEDVGSGVVGLDSEEDISGQTPPPRISRDLDEEEETPAVVRSAAKPLPSPFRGAKR